MIERQLDIPTPDGLTTTFICHPERGGPHPAILFFMDAPAIREELRDMARRLGTSGYYVMLPNLYYREGVMEIGALGDASVRERMFALMNGLSIDMVMADAAALIDFMDADPAARPGTIGTLGYCMSGQFAINAAAALPTRVAAAASIYGTYLVTELDNSPHRRAHQTKAELYFACAETDRWAPPETIEALRKSLEGTDVKAEVEFFPGVEHGFAFPQRAAYDKASAERHWERLNALYRRRLG
ncbi:MAG TPA: dienelactone hydrolase family protein [Caulobacteraceae bacterium]|jgi:carboxymethylenebutenolidase|nr:dienelactone hydrolase family protein [Caulobacteraceae bacterium]